jgi:phosphatidylinositol-3-phosphatase
MRVRWGAQGLLAVVVVIALAGSAPPAAATNLAKHGTFEGSGPGSLSPPAVVTTPSAGTAPAEPLVVIMLENKTYQNITKSTNDPYIHSLISMGTLYTNYEAAPGSLPDYLANTAGVWKTGAAKNSDNLFHQLQTAGISWGEYEESMPSTCYTGGDVGEYKQGHNPAVYYHDITSSPSACANVLPYSAFDPAHLRAFSYVVPNLLDDMHDGGSIQTEIANGDAWLSANVPAMLNAGAEVIVTWDEGVKSDEHVVAIAVGGTAAAGATNGTAYTQPGLLAGLEDAWGFPLLNGAQTATPVPIS